MSNLLAIIYVFMLIYNSIAKYIPYGNYVDELICILLLVCALLKLFIKGFDLHKRNDIIKIITFCLVVFAFGITSNIIFGYASALNVIRDFFGVFKFFIVYCSGMYLIEDYECRNLETKLVRIAKLFVIVIFVFSIVSLFVDIGMGDSVRYGIRSFQFIYTHYTYLVFNEVLLLSTIMCETREDKRNYVYYFMSFITLALTMRTKAFLFIIVVAGLSLVFYLNREKKAITSKEIFRVWYLLPVAIIGFFLAWIKIHEYISWGISNSIRVGMHYEGCKLMLDYFPLGTGFATYGTNLSYKVHSPIYEIYDLLNHQHLLDYGYATISDVYWPSIYVQFGLFGFIAFIAALLSCLKGISSNQYLSKEVKKGMLCIFLYLLVSSIAEAVFSNESGVFAPLVMVLLACFKHDECKGS